VPKRSHDEFRNAVLEGKDNIVYVELGETGKPGHVKFTIPADAVDPLCVVLNQAKRDSQATETEGDIVITKRRAPRANGKDKA
jgi:hypothetical protein